MRVSRRIWGGCVFGLGLLWLAGGSIGWLMGDHALLLMALCGFVLVRFGYGLMRGPGAGQSPPGG